MKIEIGEKIIIETTHCEMEFACLQNDANVCWEKIEILQF
jgi:hypothetical protein